MTWAEQHATCVFGNLYVLGGKLPIVRCLGLGS